MDAVNIFMGEEITYHSSSLDDARKEGARIVHWVPSESNNRVGLVMPDAETLYGYIELLQMFLVSMTSSSSNGLDSPG